MHYTNVFMGTTAAKVNIDIMKDNLIPTHSIN